jgi:signal transduction histidine kinase
MWPEARCRSVVDMVPGPDMTTALARMHQARGRHEALLARLRLVVPVLLVLVVLSGFHAEPHPGLAGRGLAVSVGLAGFLAGALGARVTLRRGGWASLAFGVLVFSCSVGLMVVQPSGPGAVGVLGAVLLFARRLPAKAAVPVAAGTFLALAVIAGASGKGPGVALLGVLGGFFGMLFLAVGLADANVQAENLLVELAESRAAEARAAGLAERQRLAREVHDVLAHSLSGLMLQLEGARMLAAEDPADPRLAQAIDRAQHLGRTGLEEARRAIGLLRDDDLPGPDRLAALVARFEDDRGITCTFAVSGRERELVPEARLAVYRVAQEALTNITKHAYADRVEVQLVYGTGGTRLSIEDFATTNGPASRAPSANAGPAGYGLTGMRERAELLGGSLVTARTPTGFRVELEVPA